MQNHNDTIITTSNTVLRKIYLSLYLKGLCVWEGLGDRTELQHIDPHSYGHQCFFPVVLMLLNRRPGDPFRWVLFSLPHLVTNSSDLQLLVSKTAQLGVPRASSVGCSSLYHILSPTGLVSKLTDFLSSPSYIIVQSPTQYLWNGRFDRHQAEKTVMQSTGHSLPVHKSMTVPWDFTLSHIVSQAQLCDFFS